MDTRAGRTGFDYRLLLVQALSLSRAAAGFIFVSIALSPSLHVLALVIYVHGTLSDFWDGYLARRWKRTTQGGGALDLFGDKYLTLSSLLYLTAREFALIPCAALAVREILFLALRSVHIEGETIIPKVKLIGGLTLMPIRAITFLALLWPNVSPREALLINELLWAGSALSLASLLLSLSMNRERIRAAFTLH